MTAERQSGARAAAGALAKVGLSVLFTLPGSHIANLLDEIRRIGANVVSVRHEENAVLMAEGWALATGTPGFVAVTAGPGLANALPGIIEANAAGVPLVVLAGRTAISRRGLGAVQDLDQLALVAPVSKWHAECLDPGRIPEYIREAYRQARGGRPGVAYLEIPEDVLATATEPGVVGPIVPEARPVPERAAIEQALELLRRSERPLVVAGSGAFFAGAATALTDFCNTTGIPVTTTSAARGLIDDDHPSCLGSLVHGGAALVGADLALVLGSRFNANLMYGRAPLFGEEQVILQVDIAAENIGGQRAPTLGLNGDVDATLRALTAHWGQQQGPWGAWREQAARAAATSREYWRSETDAAGDGVHAGWLAREAAAAFERSGGGSWISDGGDSVTWGIAFSRAHAAGSNMLIGSAMGTLGVGLPFAIAAKLAHPERPLCLFTGDGAFGFSAMELHTAARQRLGMMVVVVNNGVWRGPGSSPSEPDAKVDYAALAIALGGAGERIASRAELSGALERALVASRSGTPFVLDVDCDPQVVSNLLRGLDEMGLM